MAGSQDYYEFMGIERNASPEEIKKAYRKLALKWHPDRCDEDDAAKRFSELQEAYKILSDPIKKREYDTKISFRGGSGNYVKIGRMYFDKEDIAEKGRNILNNATSLINGFFNKK